MATSKPQTTTRRLILVGGDKGGVAKSTTTRLLYRYLTDHGTQFVAFDGDDVNATFKRFCPDARRLYTKDVKGFEPLINELEGEKPYQLVDLGSGTSIMLGKFADKTDFIRVAEENGASITFVFVLAPNVDSVNLLKIISERYPGFRYIVVRSEAIPGNWEEYDKTRTRDALKAKGAIEISLPKLDEDAFSAADWRNLDWAEAAKDTKLPLVQRSYIGRWLKDAFAQFDLARKYLLD